MTPQHASDARRLALRTADLSSFWYLCRLHVGAYLDAGTSDDRWRFYQSVQDAWAVARERGVAVEFTDLCHEMRAAKTQQVERML